MAPTPPPPIADPLPLHEFVVVSRIVALNNNYLKPLFYLRSSILLLFLNCINQGACSMGYTYTIYFSSLQQYIYLVVEEE